MSVIAFCGLSDNPEPPWTKSGEVPKSPIFAKVGGRIKLF